MVGEVHPNNTSESFDDTSVNLVTDRVSFKRHLQLTTIICTSSRKGERLISLMSLKKIYEKRKEEAETWKKDKHQSTNKPRERKYNLRKDFVKYYKIVTPQFYDYPTRRTNVTKRPSTRRDIHKTTCKVIYRGFTSSRTRRIRERTPIFGPLVSRTLTRPIPLGPEDQVIRLKVNRGDESRLRYRRRLGVQSLGLHGESSEGNPNLDC